MDNSIKHTLIKVGQILEEGFKNNQLYSEKERLHLQSEYDLKADRILKDFFKTQYPSHSIYSEETSIIQKDQCKKWIIDPIDGTSYFIFGEPFFSISIAQEIDGEIVEGHVYNPISNEYYYSDKDLMQSTLNGETINVSKTDAIDKSLLAFGFSAHPDKIEPYLKEYGRSMKQCKKALPWIAPALSICNVARGRIDAFIDYGCSYEGQAAASIILKNAGGQLFNIDNSDYKTDMKGGIFTNGKIRL